MAIASLKERRIQKTLDGILTLSHYQATMNKTFTILIEEYINSEKERSRRIYLNMGKNMMNMTNEKR